MCKDVPSVINTFFIHANRNSNSASASIHMVISLPMVIIKYFRKFLEIPKDFIICLSMMSNSSSYLPLIFLFYSPAHLISCLFSFGPFFPSLIYDEIYVSYTEKYSIEVTASPFSV